LLPLRRRFYSEPDFLFAAQSLFFSILRAKTSAWSQTRWTYLNATTPAHPIETIIATTARRVTRRTFPPRYFFNFNGTAALCAAPLSKLR